LRFDNARIAENAFAAFTPDLTNFAGACFTMRRMRQAGRDPPGLEYLGKTARRHFDNARANACVMQKKLIKPNRSVYRGSPLVLADFP